MDSTWEDQIIKKQKKGKKKKGIKLKGLNIC